MSTNKQAMHNVLGSHIKLGTPCLVDEMRVLGEPINPDDFIFCQWEENDNSGVYVSLGVLSTLYVHISDQTWTECGGVLLGYTGLDQNGSIQKVITDAVPDIGQDKSRFYFKFNASTWSRVLAQIENQSVRIIGWYHTHPGFGLFMSEDDCFTHQNFFLDGQLALVLDSWNMVGQFYSNNISPALCWSKSYIFALPKWSPSNETSEKLSFANMIAIALQSLVSRSFVSRHDS